MMLIQTYFWAAGTEFFRAASEAAFRRGAARRTRREAAYYKYSQNKGS